jgi:MFS family permease
VGLNISRAVGPALAGLAIGALGMAAPYWINALSTFAVIGALIWWRLPEPIAQSLPAERFVSAIRSGLRYARYNPDLRATLIRAAGFFPLASVYWALLPLLVRARLAGGPETYGILLGAIGAGAVCGAFALPAVARLGADRVMAGATLGTALALALFAFAREPATALIACFLAGISWVAAIATLNVSAQFALPGWVRPRAGDGDVRNRAVRGLGRRQHRLGTGGTGDRAPGRSRHRGYRVGRLDPTTAPLEASDRRRRPRSCAVDALASAAALG